jgi:hypothetical protein
LTGRSIFSTTWQSWLDGSPPQKRDWPAVAATLRQLHALTAEWPQRPGFASAREVLTVERGGDVDLSVMPAAALRGFDVIAWMEGKKEHGL